MQEGTAVEKLDELITESQAETSPKLYQLDQPENEVRIEVVYANGDEETRVALHHRLKWPDLDALIKRQRQTPQKTRMLGARRTRVQSDDGVAADAALWDKFRTQVKGYEWNGIDPDQWIDVSDELAAEIPSEHKSEAIVALFESKFEIERPKSKGFVLGAVTHRVKQTYGPYTFWHVYGKVSDRDRRDISSKSQETEYQLGQAARREIFVNLQPYVQTYDKIFERLEGVTGDDPNIHRRKDLISPIWKYGAIDALMASFEASRRDSSRN